jgi:hypothetical protein
MQVLRLRLAKKGQTSLRITAAFVPPAQQNADCVLLCRSYLARQDEQAGCEQLLREAIDGHWVFVGNSANGHAEQDCGLSLGVLLQHDPGKDFAIETAKLSDAFLDIKNKDDSVFKGANGAA